MKELTHIENGSDMHGPYILMSRTVEITESSVYATIASSGLVDKSVVTLGIEP